MQVSLPPNHIQPLNPNVQRLYPELGSLGIPPFPHPLENLQEIPFSPLPPPPPLLPPIPLMPEMELNPLYNPESLASEQITIGQIPPSAASLVLHPLTQQMMLAQHQILGAHLPHFGLNQQLQSNPFNANFISGLQPNFSSPQHFPHPTQSSNSYEPQFNTREQYNGNESENDDEQAEWRRDLKLKEKRILREKFGDNHPELVTEETSSSYLSKPSQNGTVELENRCPEPRHFINTSEPGHELSGQEVECGSEERDLEGTEEIGEVKICYPSLPLTSSDEESSFLKAAETLPQREDTTEIVPGFITRKQNSRIAPINVETSIIAPSDVGCTSPPFLSPLSSPFPGDAYPLPKPELGLAETRPFIERETVQLNITTFSHEGQFTPPPPHSLSAPDLSACSPPSAEFFWTRTRAILYPPLDVSPRQSQPPTRPIARPPHTLAPEREIKRPPNGDTSTSSNSTHSPASPYKPVKREISYPPGLEPGTSPKKCIVYPPSVEPTPEKKIIYPPPREIKRPPVLHSPTCFRQNLKRSPSYSFEREILYPQLLAGSITTSPKSTPEREIIYPPRNPTEYPVPPTDEVEESEPPTDALPDETPLEPIPRSQSPTEDISGEEDDLLNGDFPRESTPKKKSSPNDKLSDTESDVGGFQSASEVEVD